MTSRDRPTQRLIAVSLALMMLLSIGSMAFIGGAAAQTGGTFDGPLEEEEVVNSELNIDGADGDVVLLGPEDNNNAGDVDPDNVDVNLDGSIDIDGDANSLTGVGLTPERVAALDSSLSFTEGNEADFLNNAVTGNLTVDSTDGNANATIFADFDPQSDFSQINVTGNETAGTHDYIAIAEENTTIETLTDDIDRTETKGFIAASISNGDTGSDRDANLLVNNSDSFEGAVDELVGETGTSDQPVSNENLENVRFTAVTNNNDDTVSAVRLGEESEFVTDQTLHSEKIELDDGEQRYFASISEAVNASDGGNTITVDRGKYDTFEGQNVTVDTDDTLETTSRVNSTTPTIDRVDTSADSLVDPTNEAIINTSLEVDAGAAIDGFVVQNGTQAAVNITDSDASLSNNIVNYTGTNNAVNVSASGVTLSASTVYANQSTVFEDGEVGLELNENDGSSIEDNHFVGFETQVANISDADNANALFNAHETQFADDRAQSAVPFSGGNVTSSDLHGAINASDSAASDGDVINVSAGTYDEDGSVVVATDNIELSGETSAPVVENDVLLNSSTSVAFEDFEVNGNVTAVADGNNGAAVTVDTVEINDENLRGHNLTVAQGDNVDIADVTFDDAGSGVEMVNVSADLDATDDVNELSVTGVTITNLTGTGIIAPEVGDDTIVSSNQISGNTDQGATEGINVSEIGSSNSPIVNIDDNVIDNFGNGTAIALNESSAETPDTITIDNNTITAIDNGAQFVGLDYDLDQATGGEITDNTIVGANVRGGAASVGVNFVNVTVSGNQVFGGSGDLKFNNNTINGFARLVNSQSANAGHITLDGIFDDQRANEFGTVVISADEDYEGTYGKVGQGITDANTNIDLPGDTVAFIPGSIDQANVLLNNSDIEDPKNLQVFDPTGVRGPDTYVDNEVEFATRDTVVIEGENEDVTAETNFTINAQPDAENNYELRDLTIEAGTTDAITVSSNNSQSVFENLNVTTEGDNPGFNMTGTGSDVNVIEIRDSDFTVDPEADGVILEGDDDDRYGFEIENNEIHSSGLVNADTPTVGLNLTNIEKPGKQDPALEHQFVVENNTIGGFDIQTNPESATFDATSGDFQDANTTYAYLLANNNFDEIVEIANETGADAPENTTIAAGSGTSNIYGDIGTAVDNVDDIDGNNVEAITIDVQEGDDSNPVYDYTEVLTVGDTGVSNVDNVTVTGVDDNIEISGTADFAGAGSTDDVIFTGFDIVADRDTININEGDLDITVTNTTNTQTQAQADYEVTAVGTTPGDALATNVTNVTATGSESLDIEDVTLTHDIEITQADIADTLLANDTNITVNHPGTAEDEEPVRDQIRNGNVISLTANVTGATVVDNGETVNFTNVEVGDAGGTYQAPNRGGYDIINGTDVLIEDGSIDVEGDGVKIAGDDFADAGAIDVDGVTITTAEAVDTLATDTTDPGDFTTEARLQAGHGVNATDIEDDVTVTTNDSSVTATDDTAVVIDDTLNGTEHNINSTDIVSDSGAGINATLDGTNGNANSTLQINHGTDVVASTDSNATNIFEANSTGDIVVQNSSFDGDTALFLSSDIDDDVFDGEQIIGNAFVGDSASVFVGDGSEFSDSDSQLSLNYWGARNGPEANESAGIVGNDTLNYDPFLSEDRTDVEEDPTETKFFAHDLVVPEDQDFASIGFPAEPRSTTTGVGAEIQEYFDVEDFGNVYAFNESSERFSSVEPDDKISALDAFVVESGDNKRVVSIEYKNERAAADPVTNTYSFEEGLNFVPATQNGTVNEALFPGADTDFVAQPFLPAENRYGVGSQSRDDFAGTPAEAGFSGNFRSGVGDNIVHPHSGYLVIVNEQDNVGLTIGETIPAPTAPNASEIQNRTEP